MLRALRPQSQQKKRIRGVLKRCSRVVRPRPLIYRVPLHTRFTDRWPLRWHCWYCCSRSVASRFICIKVKRPRYWRANGPLEAGLMEEVRTKTVLSRLSRPLQIRTLTASYRCRTPSRPMHMPSASRFLSRTFALSQRLSRKSNRFPQKSRKACSRDAGLAVTRVAKIAKFLALTSGFLKVRVKMQVRSLLPATWWSCQAVRHRVAHCAEHLWEVETGLRSRLLAGLQLGVQALPWPQQFSVR